MQAKLPHQQQGSFINREALAKAMEESKAKPPAPVAETTSEAKVEEPKAKTDEELKWEELNLIKERTEKTLGVSLTQDHIQNYIFRGRLEVSGVVVVPGYLKGTFRTTTPKEAGELEERMASLEKSGKTTPLGKENDRAIMQLAYGWMKAGPEGQERSLGETVEDREKTIRDMAIHVVDMGSQVWSNLNFLLKYALQEKSFVKKS